MAIDTKPEALLAIVENQLVRRVSAAFPRARGVINATHETDAEIIDIGLPGQYLAATVDCLSDEVIQGLYPDAYLQGWVSVAASLSDLAAVGATPLGLLTAISFAADTDELARERLLRGMGDAMTRHGTGSLGGDLGTGAVSIAATSLGLVGRERVMRRVGVQPGDVLYTTGPVGVGNLYAFAIALSLPWDDVLEFRPLARLREAQVIAGFATGCIDTSDGLMCALDQMARLNGISCTLENADDYLHPIARTRLPEVGIPSMAAACAIHGDFELCFSVAAESEPALHRACAEHQVPLLRVGVVGEIRDPQVHVYIEDRPLDSAGIRNLFAEVRPIEEYVPALVALVQG